MEDKICIKCSTKYQDREVRYCKFDGERVYYLGTVETEEYEQSTKTIRREDE